jgi:hypothetical protein
MLAFSTLIVAAGLLLPFTVVAAPLLGAKGKGCACALKPTSFQLPAAAKANLTTDGLVPRFAAIGVGQQLYVSHRAALYDVLTSTVELLERGLEYVDQEATSGFI